VVKIAILKLGTENRELLFGTILVSNS